MKIFLVTPTLRKGGAERVVSNLSKGFSELGHEVYVVIFSGPITYKIYGSLINYNAFFSKKCKFRLFRKVNILFNFLKCALLLGNDFKKHKPDLIVSFMEDANFCSIMASKNVNVSIHGGLNFIAPWMRRGSKILYPKARNVIGVSEGLADDLRKNYNLKNVKCIYNPIDVTGIMASKNQPIDVSEAFLLSVGCLKKVKNFSLLIHAYEKMHIKYSNKIPKLIILGDGELRQVLQEEIARKNLESNILLLGSEENPYKFMAKCKLFILSSLSEGFGNVLVEAMSCAAVVISTDCPTGPREIIEHGKNGFLVKNNDLDAMVEMIESCLFEKSSEELQKIRDAAYESVHRFSIEVICQQYLNLALNSKD